MNKNIFCNVLIRNLHKTTINNLKSTETKPKINDRKKNSNKKNPNRPLTAYILFFKSIRNEVQQQNPQLSNIQIMKEVAKKWKNLSEQERKPFVDKYNIAYEKYWTEKKNLEANLPPKRPCSSFLIFANEIRSSICKENPDLPATEIAKLIGKKWNALNNNEKNHYREIYQQNLKEYNRNLDKK